MQGRNHLLVAVFFVSASLVVLYLAGSVSLLAASLVLLGAIAGALLPDIDATDSATFHRSAYRRTGFLSYVPPVVAVVTKYLFYWPVSFILKRVLRIRGLDGHRGFMHSLLGMVCTAFFWLFAGSVFLLLFGLQQYSYYYFLVLLGLSSGYFMHLWGDALTVSGVEFFTGTFSGLKLRVSGTLHTVRREEENVFKLYEQDVIAVPVFLSLFLLLVGVAVEHSPAAAFPLLFLSVPFSFVLFRCTVRLAKA